MRMNWQKRNFLFFERASLQGMGLYCSGPRGGLCAQYTAYAIHAPCCCSMRCSCCFMDLNSGDLENAGSRRAACASACSAARQWPRRARASTCSDTTVRHVCNLIGFR